MKYTPKDKLSHMNLESLNTLLNIKVTDKSLKVVLSITNTQIALSLYAPSSDKKTISFCAITLSVSMLSVSIFLLISGNL